MNPALLTHILNRAIVIQQIPAPTFAEAQRANFVHECFREEGLLDVSIDQVGNVYARFPGDESQTCIVVSAHLDTVFPLSTPMQIERDQEKISAPGIGDNALGVAGLFGLIWGLRQRNDTIGRANLPGDVWLVANVGEEGLGDLHGMRAVVDRFENQPLAYIVLEGMALGQIYHRGLAVRRYHITINCEGGHSWVDFGRPSAIHKLAEIINSLVALPLPDSPRTTLNVGKINGGISVNTIASHAQLELDLRSESAGALGDLVERLDHLIKANDRPESRIQAEIIGDRPVGEISSEHPLVRLAEKCLEAVGVKPCLNIGSTDANIPLSLGLPAICLGLSRGGGAHTMNEFVYTEPLSQGMDQLIKLVEAAFDELG